MIRERGARCWARQPPRARRATPPQGHSATHGCRAVTINIWVVADRYYPLARVPWCRRHATSSDMRAGCLLLGATASASSPGEPFPPAAGSASGGLCLDFLPFACLFSVSVGGRIHFIFLQCICCHQRIETRGCCPLAPRSCGGPFRLHVAGSASGTGFTFCLLFLYTFSLRMCLLLLCLFSQKD